MMLYVISADPEPASLWAATFKPKFVETKANLPISLRQKSHTEWNYVLDIQWVCDSVAGLCASSVKAKAGRLVGLADCYAVIVLADNATLLLADRPNNRGIISHCGSTNRTSASEFWGFGFRSYLENNFPTCLYLLQHVQSARNYPISISVERATPIPHSHSESLEFVICLFCRISCAGCSY